MSVYDVEYRWFAGPAYAVVAGNGVRAALATWTAPDTGLPGTWTEITAKVSFAGKLQRTWSGSVIDWTCDVRGWDYDATLLAEGNAIACWQRFYQSDAWLPWTLRCVGMLSKRQDRDNYQHGHAWQATIVSHSRLLSSINAPRLTAGKIRLTAGATVTASAELAQTAYEADQGEFTGGSADVGADNVVDGNRNTVYISDAVPTATRPAMPAPANYPRITEIMLQPLAGWSAANTWWVEFIGGLGGLELILGSYAGGTYTYTVIKGNWGDPTYNEFNVICANRHFYELYNGAGSGGAATIIDLSEYATLPANWLTDGMIRLFSKGTEGSGSAQSALAWSATGASRDYHNVYTTFWNGATLNTGDMVAGQSVIYDGSGNVQDPANWINNADPSPGANSLGVSEVWLKVELPENICNTLDEVSASTDPIRLNNYLGWLATGASQGIILTNIFTWQTRDANGLHGITWVSAPAAPIPAGTQCYPYADGLAQTGYPVTATHIRRRKQPAIGHYKVYWSPYGGVRDCTETGWEADYYPVWHQVQENTQTLRLSAGLDNGTGRGYHWVRSMMYLIYAMADGGRAKVNEIEADIVQMALAVTGLPDVDNTESWNLAQWLFVTWADLPSGDFTNAAGTSGHRMGNHALAITPVAQVLSSLARTTGCLVSYNVTGGVTWQPDPWWPYNPPSASLIHALTAANVRGDVSTTLNTSDVEYVILNALSLDGDPHTVRCVYPQPWGASDPPVAALVTEINDLVLARDADALLVAQREFERLLIYTRTATLTVNDWGEWCAPGQRIRLTWDLDADGVAEISSWLVQGVTTTTEQRDGVKSLRTELSLRGFRG